jgi:hypothetical protein
VVSDEEVARLLQRERAGLGLLHALSGR